MSEKALQLLDVTNAQDMEELKLFLADNFEALRNLIDGLTGERLEEWTPVLRDGSVQMTGDLVIKGGSITLKDDEGVNEISLRRGGDGAIEHRDGVNSDWTPIYDAEYRDVTSDRALDKVYKNGNKQRMCQITLKLY